MRKAPNTNKLKYVGAALLEGESVTLIQAARLVLEIKEALGDEICTITRCREVVSLGLNAIKNKHHTVSFGTAAVECLRSKSHRRPRDADGHQEHHPQAQEEQPGTGSTRPSGT